MVLIKDSAQFKQLLKGLSDDVVDAHIHYQLHQELVEAGKRHPLIMQQSNTFWKLTLQAHLNSSIYALFRAYDQDDRALHLRNWLETIQTNLHLFDEAAFHERLKDNPYVASLTEDSRKPDASILAEDITVCSSTDPIVKKLV